MAGEGEWGRARGGGKEGGREKGGQRGERGVEDGNMHGIDIELS